MGEKETPEMGARGENINASWDIVGEEATSEFTFPRDRRPANIKAGWDMVGGEATETFQEDLHPSGDFVGSEDKYESHDSQISPEVYTEAIDIARGFGVGVRRKRGESRIGLAKRFAATTVVVFGIYMAAKEGGEPKKMEAESSNTGIKTEQKKVAQRENVNNEQQLQEKTPKVEDLYPTGDIDGGSPGGMTEKGVPPEEAATNVYGDGANIEAAKGRRLNGVEDWQIGPDGVRIIPNADTAEDAAFRDGGEK